MAAQIEIRGVEALGTRLRAIGDAAPLAVLKAMRRTRTTILTRLARWVSQASGIPVRSVRRSLHGSQPTFGDPNLTMTLWGSRHALISYATGIQQENLPPSAFRARMSAGGKSKSLLLERRPLPSVRKSRGRHGTTFNLPIRQPLGPELTSFITDVGLADLLRYGGDVFKKNLEHEISFREARSAA